MERLPGRTFADEIGADRRVELRQMREVTARYSPRSRRARGRHHSPDIKPGQRLLIEDGQVKVSDFGIAKTIDDTDQTQTVELFATPGYLAPERSRRTGFGPQRSLFQSAFSSTKR